MKIFPRLASFHDIRDAIPFQAMLDHCIATMQTHKQNINALLAIGKNSTNETRITTSSKFIP